MTLDPAIEQVFNENPFEVRQDTSDSQLSPTQAALENALQHFAVHLDTLTNCITNVDPGVSEENMQTPGGLPGFTVSQLVGDLSEMRQLAPSMADVKIPVDAVNLVDSGKNPDLFLRNFVERTALENQYANAILSALTEYRDDLKSQLAEAFPDTFADLKVEGTVSRLEPSPLKVPKLEQDAA